MNDITALMATMKAAAEKATEFGEERLYVKAGNVLTLVEALEKAASEPVAWVRYCSDGTIDGPLMNYQIEDCRKSTWTPLYTVPPALESRTVTVKLPDERFRYGESDYDDGYVNGWNAHGIEVKRLLADAGIQVIEGDA